MAGDTQWFAVPVVMLFKADDVARAQALAVDALEAARLYRKTQDVHAVMLAVEGREPTADERKILTIEEARPAAPRAPLPDNVRAFIRKINRP